jgi:DNA-binding NarL/FixJ family response regulator
VNTVVDGSSESRIVPNSSYRILLIDDDPALLSGLAETLRLRLGTELVHTCPNPMSAPAMVQRAQYDLILCDVWMPQMNGLTLLPQLRQLAPRTPILMMSGVADEGIKTTALGYGATQFLAKPFDRQSLAATLKQVMTGDHEAPTS